MPLCVVFYRGLCHIVFLGMSIILVVFEVGIMPSFVMTGHFTRLVFFALLGRDFSCFVGLAPTMLIRRFGGLHPLPNDLPECW
jgi:hypothetical protein